MDLTGLCKEERKRLLIDSVKSKSSLRFKIYSDIDPLSDKELEDFFEQVHDRIDYISDSPTFYRSEEAGDTIVQKSISTNTTEFLDLKTCIGYILRSESFNTNLTYFYDIIRKKDGTILFRSTNVFDEKRWIREERNKKIDDILNTAIKPR